MHQQIKDNYIFERSSLTNRKDGDIDEEKILDLFGCCSILDESTNHKRRGTC
jgi:hypothetical protein